MLTVFTGPPQQEADVEVEGEARAVVATSRATSAGPDLRQGPRPSLGLGRSRREKAQLSCSTCRQRKTRCDRQQPCSTCVSRGQLCTYAPDKRLVPLRPIASPDSILAMHDRIVQLERLVKYISQNSIMKPEAVARNQTDANSTSEPNQSQTIESFSSNLGTPVDDQSESGSMRMSGSGLHYVNNEHWAAILDHIADLKDHFDREEQLRLVTGPVGILGDDSSAHHGALLLYGCRRPNSRQEILASLPPKTAVDRYISRYFNRVDLVASSAVHGPTFLHEYDQFWLDPSRAPIMWVGLLFGMICLAAMASAASESTQGNEPEKQRLQTELYREKIVQCLVMGEYTKAGPHVLETLMHYVYVEMLLRADSSKDIWYLLALEVNLAKRMGYHRDPSHFRDVPPLQGEMRRRLWVTIMLGDILISSQMGMPRMIVDWQCDTAEPRNLYDDDFDLDSPEDAELPPARPETEQTTALGVIARRRILVALGAVSDLTVAVKPCSYAEVMRVDGILNEALESIPPPLRMRPIAASMTDSPQLIMSRLFLAHMLYKGQIMLHRRFLRVSEDAAAYSRKACLDASLGTLQIQHILDEETCPGGQLDTMRWRITSIMNHQFLTAAMILCMLLQRGQTLQRGEEITAALWRTRAIWMRRSSGSREAWKGVETVSVVLAKFGVGSPPEAVAEGGMLVNDNPSMVLPVSNPCSSDKMSTQSEDVLPGTLDQSEPSTSVLPGLLADDQCGHNDNFLIDLNLVEDDVTLDDWVVMNGMGMDW